MKPLMHSCLVELLNRANYMTEFQGLVQSIYKGGGRDSRRATVQPRLNMLRNYPHRKLQRKSSSTSHQEPKKNASIKAPPVGLEPTTDWLTASRST